jgi:hypothetical protein
MDVGNRSPKLEELSSGRDVYCLGLEENKKIILIFIKVAIKPVIACIL